MTTNRQIEVLPSTDEVARRGASLFAESAVEAVEARGRCHVCLAGGGTPQDMYSLLASEYGGEIPWDSLHVYFSDERCVPPDDLESNYRMARDALLNPVNLSQSNVYRIPTEHGAAAGAEAYEETLRAQLYGSGGGFDLVLLGLGADAHTASLFPGTDAVSVQDRWCVGNRAPKTGVDRITLTYPALNSASRVVFLVTGASKAEALRSVLADPVDLAQRPAQGICPTGGEVIWLADREAAGRLPSTAL